MKSEVIERQRNVVDALLDRSPRLAGIYQIATLTLNSAAEEGSESARVSVICHCMRELMNGLPAVMADDVAPRPNPSSGSLTKELPKLLRKYPEVDLKADQDMIPVPQELAWAIDLLISTADKEVGRNRLNFAALVTGGVDGKHPAVKQWQDAYDFFVGWAHLDRNYNVDRPLPADV